MGAIKLKTDLQLAIANNVKKFQGNYKSLIFDKENKEHIKNLYFINNLKVKVKDGELLYDIEMNEEAIKPLSMSDIKQIQRASINSRIADLFLEKMVKYKLLDVKIGKPTKTATETVKLKKGQELKIKTMQQILKEKFNLETKLKTSQVYLSLEANVQELNFDRDMLKELESMFNELDVLAIVPNFNDVYDNIQGVRFFMGINLN